MEIAGWQVFATEPEAQTYCDVTWAAIIYGAPLPRIPEEFVALKQALDAAVSDAAGDVRSVPGDVIASVKIVPLKGLNHLGAVVDRGYSRAWAEPRVTADAQFAVPALAGFDTGGPEPAWPQPPETPPTGDGA